MIMTIKRDRLGGLRCARPERPVTAQPTTPAVPAFGGGMPLGAGHQSVIVTAPSAYLIGNVPSSAALQERSP